MRSSAFPTNPYYLSYFIALLNGVPNYSSYDSYNTTDVWGRILALNTDFRSVRVCRVIETLTHRAAGPHMPLPSDLQPVGNILQK